MTEDLKVVIPKYDFRKPAKIWNWNLYNSVKSKQKSKIMVQNLS